MLLRPSTALLPAMMLIVVVLPASHGHASADDLKLELRSQRRTADADNTWARATQKQTWPAAETAVIVCDVWDKHHCLNAVRRLEEFAPRMNEVLRMTRRRGATIIHAPSDCMPAYEQHPARQRAIAVKPDRTAPVDIAYWCSKIPEEEEAAYPIDQSDGGGDDDPEEHAAWAAELTALGRNPGMPWKMQSPLIEIDSERDYITDRGDEVWNILQSRGIRNVILVGVHTNMCVLGRPFGLRQMVRGGRNVVLVRDMTDCMYNPKCWPYVDHFTGNDLIISHIERFVCPTMTSDQILGGQPFRSRYDTRTEYDVTEIPVAAISEATYRDQWTTAKPGISWNDATRGRIQRIQGPVWIRCTVRLPKAWISDDVTRLTFPTNSGEATVWLNGEPLERINADDSSIFAIQQDHIAVDDINLLTIRTAYPAAEVRLPVVPTLTNGGKKLSLAGRWQFRIGDDPAWSNIPLPAKFGIGPDVLFEP